MSNGSGVPVPGWFAFRTLEKQKKRFTRVNNKIRNIHRCNEIQPGTRNPGTVTFFFLINQFDGNAISNMVFCLEGCFCSTGAGT